MKIYLYVVAILFAAICVNCSYAQPLKKPNVIFILADDISFDALTVNGGQSYTTPNIDFMAHHGMNFTHCESSPLCNPTRTMLLTGKQNSRNYSTWGYLSDTAKTIGNLMRDAGYNTAFFGKLQLGLNSKPAQMQNWGWNRYTIFEIMGDSLKNNQRYKSPNLVDNTGRVPDSIVKGKYCDDILTQRIFNFVDSNKTTPFFIYYSMSLCHKPFNPTPDDPQYAGWDPSKSTSNTSYFPSMVKYMDKKVGEILDKLKSVGLDTNTIVFFAGDNGSPTDIYYYANGKKVQGGKTKTAESGTHVPFIAYMPSYIAANSVNDDLIDFTDFFPTFADLGRYQNLGKYGPLDGVSFYRRLFQQRDSVRSFIFSHYAPYIDLSKDIVKRWVRNKEYKLYDSTGATLSGKFFNIKNDPEEKFPLAAIKLTPAEKALKATFKTILDTTPSWSSAPVINNAKVSNITSNSAVLSATIVNSGASKLMERGSNLNTGENAYYFDNNKKDAIAATGTFSQTRTKLLPQTLYYYSLYGKNKNASHSIGYTWGSFYTLSNPPLKQPSTLTATAGACSIKLTWNKATYPSGGATKGGYLLFYSSNDIVISQSANGKAPFNVTTDSKTRMVNLQSTLPALPAITTTLNNLSPDTLYHFTLVPYTYDGTNSLTYNYLITDALTTTKQPNSCSGSLVIAQQSEINSSSAVAITPNPSSSGFTLKMDKSFTNELVRVRVSDVAGRVYMNTKINGSGNYTFGEDLKPGVYIVYFSAGNKNYQFKIIKE